jgi:protein ImuB
VWLALYIPALPLQAFSHTLIESTPVAVFEREAHRSRIVARNLKAARLGIQRFSSLAEANALADTLVALPREPLRETALLTRLAQATSHLTPNIHICEHFGLLLDVSASISLFGGTQALQSQAQTISEAQHVRCHIVLAPTASGARWLARGHRQLIVEQQLPAWLDDLALDCTDFSPELIDELRALNLHHLAAVRQLPSAAMNRRFGPQLTLALARAYGESSESLPFWQPVSCFGETVEFLDLAREQSHWMPGVESLLMRLQDFLAARAACTPIILFRFRQGSIQHTELQLQAAHAIYRANDWLRLFNARIERLPIPHEISSIELICENIEPMRFAAIDLFDKSKVHDREWSALTTLLKLRLGEAALRSPIHQVNALPESVSPCTSNSGCANLRPTWLVNPPRALSAREVNTLASTFHFQQPERIHENWSHPDGGHSTLRDYYIALTPDHRALWLFRERTANEWFLQGIFA